MQAKLVGSYGPFTNVTYIPNMSVNLLSVSQLKRQGFHVCLNALAITKGPLHFKITENDATGLYTVTLPRHFKGQRNSACLAYTSHNLAEVYHRRFNHISKRALINVLKLHKINVPSRHFARMRMCHGCALGMALNAPVPSKLPHRTIPKAKPKPPKFTKPFELVCVDTAGPVRPVSHGGSKWLHIFKCKVTGYVHIACTRQRSGFYSEFVLFHRMLVLAHGFKTRVVRSDNAPELTQGAFAEYRAKHGITSQTSPPYSSFANGYAENAIRNASRVIRALMSETSVPARFWSFCALAYAHVFNRLPRLGKAAPMTLIKGTRPSIDYIRIFGCRVHVFVHPQERDKTDRFQPISQPGTFLGYVPHSKSFFVLVNGKVYKRRSVNFNEDVDEFINSHARPHNPRPQPMRLHGPIASRESDSANFDSANHNINGSHDDRDCGSCPKSTKHVVPAQPTPPSNHGNKQVPSTSLGSGNGQTLNTPGPMPHQENLNMPDDLDPDDQPSPTINSPNEMHNVMDDHASIVPTSSTSKPAEPRRYPVRQRNPPPRSHPVITGPQTYSGPLTRSKAKAASAESCAMCPCAPMRERQNDPRTGTFWDVAVSEHALTITKAASIPTPRTYREAMASAHATDWKAATDREIGSMHDKKVWKIVPKTRQKPIGSRWVFKAKQDEHGNVVKFKGRIVAKGFAQRYGIDFFDTWAPVARYTSIRMLLAFAARHDLTLRQLDIDTAFLNANIAEKVYLDPPPGVTVPPGHTLLLLKSLYGTKQASRSWWLDIDPTFKNTLGMQPSAADPCLYYRFTNGTMTFVCLFVDDIIIASNHDPSIEEVKKGLEKHYKLTDQGDLRWCLGMRVTRNRAKRTIQLDQERYILDVLTRFDMLKCKSVSTPMCSGTKLSADTCPATDPEKDDLVSYHALYRSIVGSVSYCALSTRPDIATATIICAKFAHNPGKDHLVAAKRILRYLSGTTKLCLIYGGRPLSGTMTECMAHHPQAECNMSLHGFTDSDWAGDLRSRKSTSGHIFFWNGGPVSWKSKMQSCIAQSTAEAEYIAASESSKEAKWLRLIVGVFEHKGIEPSSIDMDATPIGCDNQAAIAIIDNPRCSARTKHIELRYHLVRDYMQRGVVKFHYVPTQCNIADLLTKPLNVVTMQRLCRMFMREVNDNNDANGTNEIVQS